MLNFYSRSETSLNRAITQGSHSSSAPRQKRAPAAVSARAQREHSLGSANVCEARRTAIESGDTEAAETAIRDAQCRLDAAARKGIIHRRKAARSVSRLVRQLRAAEAA